MLTTQAKQGNFVQKPALCNIGGIIPIETLQDLFVKPVGKNLKYQNPTTALKTEKKSDIVRKNVWVSE